MREMETRSYKIDNIKFFLIVCVVFGHLVTNCSKIGYLPKTVMFWVYLFHMPAFAFVSGLLSKNTVRDSRWSKAVPLIFIAIAIKVINFIVSVIMKGEVGNLDLNLDTYSDIPWYALSLFWWYGITILTKKVKPAYVLSVALLLALVSGYSSDIGAKFAICRSIVFFPFFYTGYLVEQGHLAKCLNKCTIKIIAIIYLIVTFGIVYKYYNSISFWRNLFRGRYAYSKISDSLDPTFGFLWRSIFYVISGVFILALFSLMPKKKLPVVSCVGRKTLSVYAFHYAAMKLLYHYTDIKKLLRSEYGFLWCILLALCIVLFTSLPVFDYPLRKLSSVPLISSDELKRKEEKYAAEKQNAEEV